MDPSQTSNAQPAWLSEMVDAGKNVPSQTQTQTDQPAWLTEMVNAGNTPAQSAAVLGHATSQMQKTFQSPLQNIQAGQSDANVEVAKGAGKQALSDFSSAGAQNAGPVGAAMMQNAPGFQQDIQGLQQGVKPSNPAQATGAAGTSLAEMTLGGGEAKSSGLLSSIADKTGLTDYLASRSAKNAVNAIAPKLTSSEIEASPNVIRPRIGAPGVDFTKDASLQNIANDTKDIAKGKSAIDDKNALHTAIETTSEKEVKPFLSKNKVPANFEDLQKKLSLVQPQSSLKADPSAFKTYARVREEVQSSLYNSLRETAKAKGDFGNQVDFNDVWNARKILDDKTEEELGTKTFGTPEFTGAKAAIQDMRQGLTQYIKDSLQFPGQMEDVNKMQEFMQVARSKGIDINSDQAVSLMKQMGIKTSPESIARAQTFENAMSKISNYYKAMDNISTKVPDEIRASNTFGKRHPILKWAARGIGLGAGFGLEEQARKAL